MGARLRGFGRELGSAIAREVRKQILSHRDSIVVLQRQRMEDPGEEIVPAHRILEHLVADPARILLEKRPEVVESTPQFCHPLPCEGRIGSCDKSTSAWKGPVVALQIATQLPGQLRDPLRGALGVSDEP